MSYITVQLLLPSPLALRSLLSKLSPVIRRKSLSPSVAHDPDLVREGPGWDRALTRACTGLHRLWNVIRDFCRQQELWGRSVRERERSVLEWIQWEVRRLRGKLSKHWPNQSAIVNNLGCLSSFHCYKWKNIAIYIDTSILWSTVPIIYFRTYFEQQNYELKNISIFEAARTFQGPYSHCI